MKTKTNLQKSTNHFFVLHILFHFYSSIFVCLEFFLLNKLKNLKKKFCIEFRRSEYSDSIQHMRSYFFNIYPLYLASFFHHHQYIDGKCCCCWQRSRIVSLFTTLVFFLSLFSIYLDTLST